MTKAPTQTEDVKRELGEKVRVKLYIDKDTTKDLGEGVVEAVVTTSKEDRQGEVIETGGIDTANYMQNNPVVMYGHDYQSLPIGKTLKLTEMKNKIKAKFQLATEEYDFAGTVYKLIRGGYLNAVSIGGIVRRWSEDYRTIEDMEMVEFSVVPIPANAEAIITGRSLEQTAGKTTEQIHEEYVEFVNQSSLLDKLEDMPDDEVTDAVRVLKKLTARLDESLKTRSSADDSQTMLVKHIVLRDAKAVATQSIKLIKLSKELLHDHPTERGRT